MGVEKPLTRSEMKRKAILEAAREIFLSQGFSASSMDGIALLAQVSKKTIYHHFTNKEELFRSMLSVYWSEMFPKEQLFDDHKSIEYNLKRFSKIFFDFLYKKNTIDLFRILISETKQFPDLVDKILEGNRAPFTRALILFLKEKTHSGELDIQNPDRAAAYFIGLLKEAHFWPMMLGFVKTSKLENSETLIDEAIAIFTKFYRKHDN